MKLEHFILLILISLLLTSCSDYNKLEKQIENQLNEIELSEIEIEYISIEKAELLDRIIELEMLVESSENKFDEIQIKCENQKNEIVFLKENYDSEMQIISMSNGNIGYVYTKNDQSYQNITVIGNEREVLEYPYIVDRIQFGESGNSLSITVLGSIYNVRFVYFEFNDKFTEKKITETVNTYDEIRNTIIDVDSLIPEGIPYEMIIWEDINGIEHSYIIAYDGRGQKEGGYIFYGE